MFIMCLHKKPLSISSLFLTTEKVSHVFVCSSIFNIFFLLKILSKGNVALVSEWLNDANNDSGLLKLVESWVYGNDVETKAQSYH